MPLHVAGAGMTPNFLIGILCGAAAVVIAILLLRDLLIWVFRQGYERGRKEAADYWLGVGKDVEEMQKEIRYEEEQN